MSLAHARVWHIVAIQYMSNFNWMNELLCFILSLNKKSDLMQWSLLASSHPPPSPIPCRTFYSLECQSWKRPGGSSGLTSVYPGAGGGAGRLWAPGRRSEVPEATWLVAKEGFIIMGEFNHFFCMAVLRNRAQHFLVLITHWQHFTNTLCSGMGRV